MTSNTKKSLKICIVAHFAYGAMTGGSSGHIGGVERQTSFMARWLAARGHRVSLITWDEGQRDGVEIDGVRILKICKQDEGIRGVRFIHPRWTSLNKALRRADADVYYQNCGEYVTGQIALWCRFKKRRFVYSVAANADCQADLPLMPKLRERILYRYGLRNADRIVVQTQIQQQMLVRNFGCDPVVIPMPCQGPDDLEFKPPDPPDPGRSLILWVGRICEVKRADKFLELARMCPDLNFQLIGPGDGSEYSRKVIVRAKEIPNISFYGPATYEQLTQFYLRASCLCSTSDFEGFPNTYLEAWSFGLPVITTFDPDNIVAEKNLGAAASDVPGLARSVRNLLASPDLWKSASANARQYYVENHSIERVLPRFEQVFRDVLMDLIE
jgi:glycosyltransferase involved in cell wall biosynthesis